ncbi:MAG TPA: TIGR01777 family oxidoreductase [Baekduia sp.]
MAINITITGATGLIGTKLVKALRDRGDGVTVLSRSPEKASAFLGVEAFGWDPLAGPAPADALVHREAVVHLAGEPVAQRWSAEVKLRIRASREVGTRNLVAGLRAAGELASAPKVLVSASAVGYYGPRGDERVPESTPAGGDFLAEACVAWEREAAAAAPELGARVVSIRTGVVLDQSGGALKTMLPPFRLGIGGPVAGGAQYLPWIHADDIVGLYLRALDDPSWSGPYNGAAPEPVTNKAFSKALGRALHRPAVAPVPGLALKLLYGDMAEVVTQGQRAVPDRALAGGFAFRFEDLDAALGVALKYLAPSAASR